jgi:GNAT superfamily N-acetyltransferase
VNNILETLSCIEVTDSRLLEKIYRLRVKAWEVDAPPFTESETWTDRWDPISRHWAVLNGDEPIAAARLSLHTELENIPDRESYLNILPHNLNRPIASLNRLVVHPDWRKRGLSRRLDVIRLEAARAMGAASIIGVSDSGRHRIKQLVSLGFSVLGEGGPASDAPATSLPMIVVLLQVYPCSS